MAKTYAKAERSDLDRQLENMTDDQLRALELAGGKLLRESNQSEYMRRYRQRIALAALKKGMIQADEL